MTFFPAIPTDESKVFQARLAHFNRVRLTPSLPNTLGSPADLSVELTLRSLEKRFLEKLRHEVAPAAATAPTDLEGFIEWFEDLRAVGPGQGDPLFPWLESAADPEEMRWFLHQELAGEAGFDDLVALTQVRMPAQVKLELARNYWDEMGRGREPSMHGEMLRELAEEVGASAAAESVLTEVLALNNLMVGLAINREYAYHSIGCLGVVELTAPDRARAVAKGLNRLGFSARAQRYHAVHSVLDVQHSKAWNENALKPLLRLYPECATAIAEGALMRLQAGANCFERYRRRLYFDSSRMAG